MRVCFRVKGDQKVDQFSILPFEIIRREWKDNVGSKTVDGDLIVEVLDISDEEIEVYLNVTNEKNLRFLGGRGEPVSFSFSK